MITKNANLTEDTRRFTETSDEVIKLTRESGIVVDMAQWLTIKRYSEKYGTSTQVVSNWIARGIIPTDCVMDLPELNDIRLVKDQVYR